MLSRALFNVFIISGILACEILLLPVRSHAQIVSFNAINQSNGLRNGNVRTIIKDYQGFMWFGTEDGLHRYDGTSMKIYRKDENDSTSISSNFILCLYEDSQKHLWVGTLDGGLCVYDRQNDNFIRFTNPQTKINRRIDDAARVVFENRDHELFVGSGQLLRAHVETDVHAMKFRNVDLPLDTVKNAGLRIMDITAFQDSLLLLGFNNFGLCIYNAVTNHFSVHPTSRFEKNIQAIHVDKQRKVIWAGTWKNGLLVSDYSGKKSRYIKAGTDKHTIRNNYVPNLDADVSGNLWIATDYGLSQLASTSDPFVDPIIETYLPDSQNQSSLHGSIIKTVYNDPADNLWVGIYYNGVSLYHKQSTHFGTITLEEEKDTRLPEIRNVSAFAEGKKNALWLGTDGAGLFVSHDTLGNGTPHFKSVKSCQGIEKIKSLALDQNDNLWIGTWGKGLFIFNTNSLLCTNYSDIKTGVDIGTEITSVEIDRTGDVWIGTFDNGAYRYSPDRKSIVHLKGSANSTDYIDRISVIQSGHGDDIWIAKEAGGLNKTSVGKAEYKTIETKHLKSSTTVLSVYADREGTLWVGCPSSGLIQMDLKTDSSVLYTEHDGLGNSMIYSILEDNKGRLWLSTDAGLTMFDKSTKKFLNFGLANGLLSNQFNKASAFATRTGYLLFGNIKGANYVPPNALRASTGEIPVTFTKLFINNREQVVGKPESVLQKNILVTPEIELDPDQNSISVEVAALSFDFSRQPEYYYKLEGFNETWQYSGTQPLIQYTNLEPSTYTLQISTSAPDDPAHKVNASLRIVIHPAWWQTSTFRIGSVITFVLLALAIHRVRIRYLLAQKNRLELQVTQRTQRLDHANQLLKTKLDEINEINNLLKRQQDEIIEKNNEIQAQNEELTSQNELIAVQHENLISAKEQLREINLNLEKVVDERTYALQKTIDDLNKIVFELDRFVYSASHDLSAPLKSILGLVQIINLETDRSKIGEYADLIKASVQKLEDVIRSMVDYARNSHMEVSTVQFSVSEIVDDVFRELKFLPGTDGITFSNNISHDLLVKNDPSRVKVILHNLVGNCIKYVDKNKATPFVTVDAFRTDSGTTICVADNGIGIRAELLDKIFNMYFRGTVVSKGSGLGLFIVKETANKIGGKVSVQSTNGEGSKFEVTIPEMQSIDQGEGISNVE